MGCNLLVLELVLKGIGRVHQTDFVISHQWIEFILVTETQKWHLLTEPISVQIGCNMAKLVLMGIGSVHKCHLQSPHMLVQTELLLMMSLFKHVPWAKWFEKHVQYSNF